MINMTKEDIFANEVTTETIDDSWKRVIFDWDDKFYATEYQYGGDIDYPFEYEDENDIECYEVEKRLKVITRYERVN